MAIMKTIATISIVIPYDSVIANMHWFAVNYKQINVNGREEKKLGVGNIACCHDNGVPFG